MSPRLPLVFCAVLLLAQRTVAAPEEAIPDPLPTPKTAALLPQTEAPTKEGPRKTPGPTSATSEVVAPLKVTLTPGQTGARDIYDELTIFVELTNSGNEVITLQYVYLQVGDDVKRTRGALDRDKVTSTSTPPPTPTPTPLPSGERPRGALNFPDDGTWEGRESHEPIKLNPNGSRTERLVIPRAEHCGYLMGLLRNQYLLTFSPREHDVHVMVEYAIGRQDDLSLHTTIKVPFTSTWGSIMLGGCLGVLLLCVLSVISAIQREVSKYFNPPADGTPPPTGWQIAGHALRTALREVISATVWFPSVIILSFLLWRMGPSSFPITFQVNDFAGGVLLGLFTRALVEPLIRKLFPDPNAPAT